MNETDTTQLRTAQAENAELLAALLREHALPAIGWYITGTDGHVEGQIYREDAEATRAELHMVADLLNGVVKELSRGGHEAAAWNGLGVKANYHGMLVTVFGYADDRAAH